MVDPTPVAGLTIAAGRADGRKLKDNYGYPANLTYAKAAEIAFTFRIRANQEQAVVLCLAAALMALAFTPAPASADGVYSRSRRLRPAMKTRETR